MVMTKNLKIDVDYNRPGKYQAFRERLQKYLDSHSMGEPFTVRDELIASFAYVDGHEQGVSEACDLLIDILREIKAAAREKHDQERKG